MARRVLVVDDEEQIRRLIGVVLAEAGYEAACAPDGEEALKKVGGNSFDLITLDLAMPGMDGWEVLEGLERKSCSPPVLVVSANCFTSRPRPLFSCLAGWLPKPFRVEELLRTCDRVLRPRALPPPEGFSPPRRAERRLLLLPATLEPDLGGTAIWGQILDLSPIGAQFDVGRPRSLGRLARVGFALPGVDREFVADAEVRWQQGSRVGLAFLAWVHDQTGDLASLLYPRRSVFEAHAQ